MGTNRPEREVPLARAAYIAAARRFLTAVSSYLAVGVPLDPGSSTTHVRDWSRDDVAALQELHTALGQLLETRRAYDAVRRRR
ncbi:hypothetical protein [Actinoplanes sp. URMC 104]|uniref:hypothetical protein n=1 Tax=Actinoplanes sp. URMC 104 TaxID=3423409 RepID=UPI003F1AEA28